jgi:MFS family permease
MAAQPMVDEMVRQRWRGVSLPLAMVIGGGFLSSLGTGLVVPLTIIYLHNIRGISLALSGTLLSLLGLAGLAVTPLASRLIHRIGGVRTLALALSLLGAGYGGLAFVTGPVAAVAAFAVAGCGNGMFWPAQKTLLAMLTPPGRRHLAFSLDQIAGNVGIGLGAVAGGLVIGLTRAASGYSLLFLLNGASFVVFIFCLPWRRRTAAGTAGQDSSPEGVPDPAAPVDDMVSWRAILRHRAMRRLLRTQLVVVMFGVVGFEQLLPAFLRNEAAVPASLLGVIFTVNVVSCVVIQMVLPRLLAGRRRAASLSQAVFLWALLWLGVAIVTSASSGMVVFAAACGISALFALGESVIAVTVDPTVSDIASPRQLGRYMSALILSWNIGFIVGPIIGGLLLEFSPRILWPVLACPLILASIQARRLHDDLPQAIRLIEPL